MWTDLRQDVAYALRTLAQARAFTAAAVLMLAVGIGGTTAVFSLVNWTLLRPHPGVAQPHELITVWTGSWSERATFQPSRVSYLNFEDLEGRVASVSGLAAYQGGNVNVAAKGRAARSVAAQFVTTSYFQVLGLKLAKGRPFTQAENDPRQLAGAVAVLSNPLWQSMFGDAASMGQSIVVNGRIFDVIGVMAADFAGTDRLRLVDIWIPGVMEAHVRHLPSSLPINRAGGGYYELFARLRPGVSRQQAEAELQSLGTWLADRYPTDNEKFREQVKFVAADGLGNTPFGRSAIATPLAIMLGICALVLLIACANVANLMMMRGVGRRPEVAVRKALGATPFRLLRQHLTEGVTLWALGGLAGLGIAVLLTRALEGVAVLPRTQIQDVPIDWRVVTFASGVSLLVGLVFSVLPARRAVRIEAIDTLKQGSGSIAGRSLGQSALTIVQLSSTLALFVGALLLLNTVRNLSQVPLGFDPDGVATFGVSPQQLGYTPEAAYRYAQEFARRLRAMPGIQSVVVSEGATPFTDANGSTRVRLAGDARNATLQRPLTATLWTTDYFETMRIPIRRGRVFDLEDLGSPARPARRLVVVNEQLALALFGSIDAAVGQSIEFAVRGATGPCEVIGVVGNARYQSLTAAFDPMVYEPAGLEAWTRPSATITLRTSAPLDIEAVVRDIGSALDASLAVPPVTSLAESIATRGRAAQDFLASLLGALAAIAAVLSALGVYALVSFGVATRRREFGIRAAVGAAPAALRRLVLGRTATLTGIGLVIGLGGAYALAKMLESRLFGVLPFDPLVWTTAACGLIFVAFAASLLPARRASAADPMRALREL